MVLQTEEPDASKPVRRVRVVVADDHLVVRQGVRALLQAPGAEDIALVGEAETGEEAVRLCRETNPDVMLLDWRMPPARGMEPVDSVETALNLGKVAPHTRIVVLTSFDGPQHVLPAVRAGAFSYLLKDVSANELLKAVRRAARGEPTLHPQAAQVLMRAVGASGSASKAAAADTGHAPAWTLLSPREMEVLQALSEGLSNAEIAFRFGLSEKTIKTHVSSILAKLDVSDRTQAAVYAWRHGLEPREEKKP